MIQPSVGSGKVHTVDHRPKRITDSRAWRLGRLAQLAEKDRGAYKQNNDWNTKHDRSHESSSFFSVGPSVFGCALSLEVSRYRAHVPRGGLLMAFVRSPHAYRTAHGIGFQPAASVCFLKWA